MAFVPQSQYLAELDTREKKAVRSRSRARQPMQAINTFILEGERVLGGRRKGIALNPGTKDVDEVIVAFAPKQRATNIENGKKFAVKNPSRSWLRYLTAQESGSHVPRISAATSTRCATR